MQRQSERCVNCVLPRTKINRKLEAIELLGGVCVRCGTTENLQFDHIDPETKLFNISTYFEYGDETTFWMEVAKCQLLCFPHHTEKCILEGMTTKFIGEANGMAKLRELDVKYIRGLSELGYTQSAISKEFDVSKTTIGHILNGKTWKHVV